MKNIRSVRLLVDTDNILRRLCKLSFSNKDSSLYIFPYAPNNRYFLGSRSMPEKEFEEKVHFRDDLSSTDVPKISIHESGQVHTISGKNRVGPLQTSPLSDLRGEHIATVEFDDFSILPAYTANLKKSGKDIDHVIPLPSGVRGGKFIFYAAGDKPSFQTQGCQMIVSMARKTLSDPLYIGIKAIPKELMGDPDDRGIMVIAGWDPTGVHQEGADFLYVRGL